MITAHYEDTSDYFLERRYEGVDLDEAIELLRHELLLDYLPLNRSEVMQLEDKLRVAEKGVVIVTALPDRTARVWWTERPPLPDKPKPHYTYCMGMHGCLPMYGGSAETREEAIDALIEANDRADMSYEDFLETYPEYSLTREEFEKRDELLREEMLKNDYAELLLHYDGNEYMEVNECACNEPSNHDWD